MAVRYNSLALMGDQGISTMATEFEEELQRIAARFQIEHPVAISDFPERGNINLHTYLVATEDHDYLLQRINTEVFSKPKRVMSAMVNWITAQNTYLASDSRPNTIWEPITLVPTHEDSLFLELGEGDKFQIWRLMKRISSAVSYKSLGEVAEVDKRSNLAEEVGRGLAINADLVSSMPTGELVSSLPGYRDTRGYFNQLRAVLQGCQSAREAGELLPSDPEVRTSTEHLYYLHISEIEAAQRRTEPDVPRFLSLIAENETFALSLADKVATGEIRRTAIHGDTKIENFLFCVDTGRVKSLVDLDTIMPYTWLADWGDMMRSLCNVAGEKERDLSKIQVDRDIYECVVRGFLTTAKEVTPLEISLMPEAVEIITLELGTRFLTDYLRGDNYFQLGPQDAEDLNKVRGFAQLTLFERLREMRGWATLCIERAATEA